MIPESEKRKIKAAYPIDLDNQGNPTNEIVIGYKQGTKAIDAAKAAGGFTAPVGTIYITTTLSMCAPRPVYGRRLKIRFKGYLTPRKRWAKFGCILTGRF